ncbi:hypothetical protein JW960_18660 [candidate division KSB1 bacterium]|nr:hypothetical protein [candidate division KSB1 bacterium]
MRSTLIIFFVCCISIQFVYAQDSSTIGKQIDSLSTIRENLATTLKTLKKQLSDLETLRFRREAEKMSAAGIVVALKSDGEFKNAPAPASTVHKIISQNTDVKVIGYTSDYFKVVYDSEVGFIHEIYFPENEALDCLALRDPIEKSTELTSK